MAPTFKDGRYYACKNGFEISEISGLDSRVITTEYRTRVHCIHVFW